MAVSEMTTLLTGAGAALAFTGERVLDYEPMAWSDSAEWCVREKKLKNKYGTSQAMPGKWEDVSMEILASLPVDVLSECVELVSLGKEAAKQGLHEKADRLERKAIRLAYCCKLAHVWKCPDCGRPGKKVSCCRTATCLYCAKKNFDALFSRYSQVDDLIPAAVRSLPGYGWWILDFDFRHDGDFPEQWELKAMHGIVRRTVQRAVREVRREWYDARRGCRLRLDPESGQPMISPDGWPMAGTEKGEMRELKGWTVFRIPEHRAPDNKARKSGERGIKKTIPESWKLRFGYDLLRVREFGFDNVNAHFHSAFFGPHLDYWKSGPRNHLICGGRLVDIFREETSRPRDFENPSRGGLGVESYTVFFEEAARGYRSVLAHALKYTEKIPASSGKKRAKLEEVMDGTRRVALSGMHAGVPMQTEKVGYRCSSCGGKMERVKGLGLVLLSEIEDLLEVIEPERENSLREPGADEFLEEVVRGP